MFGPYEASKDNNKTIRYKGNKIFPEIDDIRACDFSDEIIERRLQAIVSEERFGALHNIDNSIFFATTDYFRKAGADWVNLPLTTLMISSPGEIYRGKRIDYSTDSPPISLKWFEYEKSTFLSESSQFYLEMRLLQKNVEKVFSIYNSFRKEKADFCHLTEFQHIEFEGHVDFEENINISINLLRHIVTHLLTNNRSDLSVFLSEEDIASLANSLEEKNITYLTFREAIKLLYDDTGEEKYQEQTLKHFGAWEEIRLTNILGKHVILTEFPLAEIPFYHNELKHVNNISVSESADVILYGYRETIGSGVRIKSIDSLMEKAKHFNLPPDDYKPYLDTRKFSNYQQSAGFGLGWQRLTHWLLKLPAIWEASHIPRGHLLPKP
jgi:aspartyl/asparaginyl-tRNA synthetase